MRPALLARLDRALDVPLTLISAPAGFGKSSLAAQWLDIHDHTMQGCPPNAWLSLDAANEDLYTFVAHLIASIRLTFPTALSETLGLLSALNLPQPDFLAVQLANDLALLLRDVEGTCRHGLVVVLDDYDRASSPLNDKLLDFLLRHPVHGLHLVVATRRDPALQLSRLRARNEIVEIRSRDLRLSPTEVSTFLQERLPNRLTPSDIEMVAERTEGWLAGLQLARIVLAVADEGEGMQVALDTSYRFTMDYLVDEVLSLQPQEVQTGLLRTSILEQFCEPLVAALGVTPLPDAKGFLERLEAFNLFVVGLDGEGIWYRYHHLFRNLLRRQLEARVSAPEIANLHRRAAIWHSEHGVIEVALSHALQAEDTALAVQIVGEARHTLIDAEEFHRLRCCLDQLPRDAVDASPVLLLAEGWLGWSRRMDIGLVEANRRRANALLDECPLPPAVEKELRGECAGLECIGHFSRAEYAECIAQAQDALAAIPRSRRLVRSIAWVHLAGALFALGQRDLAFATLDEAMRSDSPPGAPGNIRPLVSKCFLHWMDVDLDAMLVVVAEGEARMGGAIRRESKNWINYFRACVAYERNDLDLALTEASALIHDPASGGSALATIHGVFIAAFTHLAAGRPQEAILTLEEANRSALVRSNPGLTRLLRWAGVELDIRLGRTAGLAEWVEKNAAAEHASQHNVMFYTADLTLPRAQLALDTPGSRHQARAALARLLDVATAHHNDRIKMEALALLALLEDREGHRELALDTLRASFQIALHARPLRLYADAGPRMAALVAELGRRGFHPEYMAHILDACIISSSQPATTAAHSLPEPLTEREVQVLGLLAERFSNKEIAGSLVISTLTVKRHTINIYAKLQVDNRRDAVARAQALGILPRTNGTLRSLQS